MGAAASRDPPRALVEACATLDASELREIARRFRDASRPPPTTRAEDENLLGDAWPAAETPRALALALVALPDALDPANPALASAFDLPPGAVAESAFTPAREYETGDADDPRRDIDSAATPNSQTPRRAPPRGAFPWTVAARAAALRESRDAREAAARSALALAFEREEASRSGDEDATTTKTEALAAALRHLAAAAGAVGARRTNGSSARRFRTFGRTPDPHRSELSDEDLFVLRPLDAIAAACVGECASDARDRDELARRCVAFLAARCPAAIDAFGVALLPPISSDDGSKTRSKTGRSVGSVPELVDERGAAAFEDAFEDERGGGSADAEGGRVSERVGRTKHTYRRALITRVSAWALAGSMPSGWRVRWRRVFHSDLHGASFASFLTRTGAVSGATLVAVRTRAGDVLGGVASEPLRSRPEFFGDERGFVFALGNAHDSGGTGYDQDREERSERSRDARKTNTASRDSDSGPSILGDARSASAAIIPASAGAHRSSGANANHAWCASGFVSEHRFPNGVGFGGQIGHFSLFLDADFERGHCRFSAATFGAPRLVEVGGGEGARSGATFAIDAVEAWALEEEEETSGAKERFRGGEGGEGGVRSARHAEARALMEAARRDAGGPERHER